MLKRTPLFEIHQELGGRMVEFGGWEMPVQYTSIMDEHLAVRKAAGIFDISHMGEIFVSGNFAEKFLNHLLTNDVRKLAVGQGQYTLMCNERGGVVDDLYVYRVEKEIYLLIVNASRIEEDAAWILRQMKTQVPSLMGHTGDLLKGGFQDQSKKFGAVAIQGPRVVEFIDKIFSVAGTTAKKVSELKKNEIADIWFGGGGVLVSRTGYTGEDGFEVVAPNELIAAVWSKALEIGKPFGLIPAGLGARDTLRTEVCYPLYGHELDENTTPIEAGVGFFVALDKGDFIGREALAEQNANGVSKKCVAFKMTDKSAPPRPHYPIWSTGPDAAPIGEVVSGTQSPSLGIGIGMGYVKPEFAKAETRIEIEIRGKRCPAVVVKKPLYVRRS